MKIIKYQILWLCVTVFSAPLAAAEQDDATDITSLTLEQLAHTTVTSASRFSQELTDAPNAMTIITREMIATSGFRSLPDVFKLVPGMYVSYYTGAQPIVSYHGSLSQYAHSMQVLIDGRSVYLPPFNTVDWTLLPLTLSDIERIEVIRGPAAASYGENSVQGVINIITRDAGAIRGTQASVTHGSKGINDVTGQFGRRGEDLDYRLTLGYRADNGYDNLTTPPNNMPITAPGANTLLNNTNDSNQMRMMNYRATYRLNAADNIQLQLGTSHDVQGVGFWDSGLDKMHDMFSHSNFQHLEWDHEENSNSSVSLRYYHIQHGTNEIYQLGAPAYNVSTSTTSGRNEVELQHTLQLSDNKLAYGIGYRQDKVDVTSYYPPVTPAGYTNTFRFNESRIYANDAWQYTSNLVVNIGGMLEHDAMNSRHFSPRASLNYHLTPHNTLRTGVSIAYRTPSIGETNANGANQYQLGYAFQPGPTATVTNLVAEKIISREIGYLGDLPSTGSSLDLRIYHDNLSNLIYPTQCCWANGLAASNTGAEATIKQILAWRATLTLNYAYQFGRSNFNSLSPGQPDYYAMSFPRHNGSMLYSQHLADDTALSAGYYFRTASQGFDRNFLDFQPTQRRTDIRISKSFKASSGLQAELSGVVQNVFRTNYTEYVASALFTRVAYVMLTLH